MSLEQTVAEIRALRGFGLAKPRRRIPRQLPPTTIARSYALELLELVDQTRAALAPLLEALPHLLASAVRERGDETERRHFSSTADSVSRADAGEMRQIAELIERARRRMVESVQPVGLERIARMIAGRTERHHRLQLDRQIQAALGVSLPFRDPKLRAQMDHFVAENVALIKDIPTKIIADIEQAITRGVTAGKLHRDLAKDIDRQFGFGAERAKLIARDQVGKFYGQVNAARQKDLGITRFIWRTVHDRRVRGTPGGAYPHAKPSHFHRDNITYEYAKPPNGELPGEPILCRCYADPDFSSMQEAVGITPTPSPAPPAPPEREPSAVVVPVPRTPVDAATRIARALEADAPPNFPGFERVRDNWKKKIDVDGIPESEFSALDRAVAMNADNPQFSKLKERYGSEVVVLTKPPAGVRVRAERLGRTTFVYHTELAGVRVASATPVPSVATTESWGGAPAVLRHEYGHTVYDAIVRNPATRDRWREIMLDDPSVVSKYSKLKDDEAFAETLAVVTDPKFDPSLWDANTLDYFAKFKDLVGL